MVNGLESARSVPHLVRLFELADQAGMLLDPDLAVDRLRGVLALAGFAMQSQAEQAHGRSERVRACRTRTP